MMTRLAWWKGGALAPAAPPASAIAGWSFAELPAATYLIDEKNTGTARARLPGRVPGRVLSFDGVDDHVNTGVTLNGATEFSIWRRAKYLTTSSFDLDGFLSPSGSDVRLGRTNTGVASYANGVIFPSSVTSIANGVWHTLACTSKSAGTSKLYLDNMVIDSRSVASFTISNALNFPIGMFNNNGSLQLGSNFIVDEYRIYDRQLTQNELLYLDTGGASGTDPTLTNCLAHYKFEESTGATDYDSSGSGNHGTLNGGVTRVEDGTVQRSWANDFGYSPAYIANDTLVTATPKDDSSVAFSCEFKSTDNAIVVFTNTSDDYFIVADDGSSSTTQHEGATLSLSVDSTPFSGTRDDLHTLICDGSWHTLSGTVDLSGANWRSGLYFGGHSSGAYHANDTVVKDVVFGGVTYDGPVIVPRDESDTGNDVLGGTLTYTGTAPIQPLHKASACRVFDGIDDYIGFASGAISHTGNTTIAFRYKASSAVGTIFDSDSTVRITIKAVASGFRLDCGGDSPLVFNIPVDDEWYHVAFSISGTTLSVYVDGELFGSSSIISAPDFTTNTTNSIGSYDDGSSSFFTGSLCDFRIYSSALDATAVGKVYSMATDQSVPTVTWHTMSGTGGVVAHNVVANANHGTVYGGTAIGTQDVFHYNLRFGAGMPNNIPALSDKSGAADGFSLTNPATEPGHNGVSTKIDFTGGVANDPAIDTYALALNGTSQYAKAASRVTSGTITQLFASCWVKFIGTQASKIIQGEFRTGSSHRQWCFATSPDGTRVEARVYVNGDDTTYKAYGFAVTNNDDLWHHVSMYFNSGTLKIYINGVEDTSPVKRSDGTVASIWNGSAVYAIGAGNTSVSAADFFAGTVQQCRVYTGADAAAAAADVSGVYEETFTGTPRSNHSLINSLVDTSGNSYTLTLTGGPTFTRILPPTDWAFGFPLPPHMRKRVVSSVLEDQFYIKG